MAHTVREVERQELAFNLIDEDGHVVASYRNAEEAQVGAAAPDLLAALRDVGGIIADARRADPKRDGFYLPPATQQKIGAALAKAGA